MAGSRAARFFKGCAIGCGIFVVLGIGSCVGFVTWIKQPGELIDTGVLLAEDTAGYAEWHLSLDDPGTEGMVMGILELATKARNSIDTDMPAALDVFLKDWQNRRDEKKLREIFPLVVAWNLQPGPEDDLHQVTLSVERLGNRLVFIDWILGWTLGRSDEVQVVRHGGEKIYQIADNEVAFFLRRSDVVFSSSLGNAENLVDRLNGTRVVTGGTVQSRLANLPDRSLRAVISNADGELERVMNGLSQIDVLQELSSFDWSLAESLALTGGFTDGRAFSMVVEIERGAGEWPDGAADLVVASLAEAFGDGELKVAAGAQTAGRRLVVDIEIPDLPSRLEALAHRIE